ncbi:hypothetical protein COV88_00480 [Candidatus Saccharibacteria bacterium CG11_big_fil_rev_8_21_14_0_20_41_19]|nr:hypothetical protein [Candidatus Saccharibacteria bacterium]OIP85477.1 MAG: hypothetical protein AUK57_04155 [Candidatus Saccharibacteria bacterium CG2_30_41_52]PIQ71258.1 MAG: hypothetical protein COV88_00480 [Candidatus Saccharibacteria bacterium CG11_big_fil_rev_8_21_14_0_20_41_19]PIZ59795.1 MAG: hypothetical protein COY18_02395 [Candidatus Saccharibacteria bacterium CG_4_10_14_0_2_um_filter_41_11]PJC29861.1 MAG: hypothetical protein CO052_01195 [Candidatus Saccharibacteria bacterium CG_4
MNIKKTSIIISTVIVVLMVAGFMLYDSLSTKNIHFTSTYPDTKISITSRNNQTTTATITGDQYIKLKTGVYSAQYQNNELNHDSFDVVINNDTQDINLDPNYSGVKLYSILKTEDVSIKKIISTSYKSNNYIVSNEKLYHRAEWFSCSLIIYKINPFSGSGLGDPDNYDDYHIVLKKDETSKKWVVVGKPSLLLNKLNNPSIPDYVLADLIKSN